MLKDTNIAAQNKVAPVEKNALLAALREEQLVVRRKTHADKGLGIDIRAGQILATLQCVQVKYVDDCPFRTLLRDGDVPQRGADGEGSDPVRIDATRDEPLHARRDRE